MIEVASVPRIGHREAARLAATEFDQVIALLGRLTPDDWAKPTSCEAWDVRDMVAHVVGMAEMQASVRELAHVGRTARAAAKRDGGPMIDAMTATQVRDRADLSPRQLVDRLVEVAPRAVRARRRIPAPLRRGVRMKQDPPFATERWTLGYLFDIVCTRDPWMHRLDISRATGRAMDLRPDHDGRLVADLVADWARRHGRPFRLTLTGPAGGRWRSGPSADDAPGASPENIELDTLDFCWALSGRAPGEGLLATPVPF
jgi:uncharacterized protein (TIGR03083 family)